MAVNSGIFNSVAGDRKYDASWFAEYFASFIGNGIFPNPSNGMQVMEYSNMQTVIKPGKGWINGYYVTNTEDYIIQHDMADSALSRIDRIVLQKSTADRAINIVIKKGTLASSPTPPVIVRNADYHELVLADVSVSAGATRIIQGNITDQRLNNNLCGIAHAVVDQVDTTTIFNQYESWFNDYSVTKVGEFLAWQNEMTNDLESWIESQEQDFLSWRQAEEQLYNTWLQGRRNDFDIWFATIQNILDTNVAGNLLNMIEGHKNETMPHIFLDETDNKIYKYGFKATEGSLKFIYEEVK